MTVAAAFNLMKILVTGGTGFVGTPLIQKLLESDHQVIVLAKHPPSAALRGKIKFFQWEAMKEEPPLQAVDNVDAVLHLAGDTIFGFWTKERKRLILQSRELGTRNLVSAIEKASLKPQVLISASAVGYYGDRGEQILTEENPPGKDFLAETCKVWEEEARRAEAFGLRTVQIRTAPVLGGGGLLKKILPSFLLGLGARFGSGNQWFSWIHLEDIVRVYVFCLQTHSLSGPVNACSPNSIRNKDFVNMLATAIRRPAFLSIPPFLLKLVFGDMANVILASQRVFPQKLLEAGFQFRFPDLGGAVEDIFRKK